MLRYILFGIAILAGLIGGLYFGWEISPVDFGASGPELLREDFKADYVLMVAESYWAEQNPETAARALALFSETNSLQLADAATSFGLEHGYSPQDMGLLNNLHAALLAWSPDLALTPTVDQ